VRFKGKQINGVYFFFSTAFLAGSYIPFGTAGNLSAEGLLFILYWHLDNRHNRMNESNYIVILYNSNKLPSRGLKS
jgi:hypothetical protein